MYTKEVCITFKIETIKIQTLKGSHPIVFSLRGVRSLSFAVTVIIITDFIYRFSGKARKIISYLYTCTYLTPRVTTPRTPYFPFNRV